MSTTASDRNSLSKQVFLRLRENILNETYPNGYPLIETKLAKELGVSRTPIRDALHQLEQEGLAISLPNRSIVVQTPSVEDFDDIYTVRQMLEGQVARWASERASAADIDRLNEIVALMELYTTRADANNLTRLDTEFHHLLYDICKSKTLKQVLRTLHANSVYIRSKSYHSSERTHKSLAEHQAICEAISSRNSERASQLLTEHVGNAHAYSLQAKPLEE